MPTYSECDHDVRELLQQLMEKYHKPLADAEVQVDLVFAYATTDENGDKLGPALKKNGLRAAAIAKNIGLKERTKGCGDCEISIDGDEWPTYTLKQKKALLDHELTHFELKIDKHGLVVRDDLERPKIRIRPHDREVGWFDAVVNRHGREAFEFSHFNDIWQSTRQMNLPFNDIG